MTPRLHPSPNHGPRRGVAAPDCVILHYTDMLCPEAALERLCDPAAEVSAHYLIAEDGRLWALVPETERAWHAGVSFWAGERDMNSRSIGIELANPGHGYGHAPFPAPQMRALEDLLCGIRSRWGISPERVLAHSDIAPRRKQDPGPRLDWRGLARRGFSIWPAAAESRGPSPVLRNPAALLAPAARFGFETDLDLGGRGRNPSELGGHGTAVCLAAILRAVRLRFRPHLALEAPPEARDLAILEDLAQSWPARVAEGASRA